MQEEYELMNQEENKEFDDFNKPFYKAQNTNQTGTAPSG